MKGHTDTNKFISEVTSIFYKRKFGALYFQICLRNYEKMQQVLANFGLKSLEETQDFPEILQFHGSNFRILALIGTIGHL